MSPVRASEDTLSQCAIRAHDLHGDGAHPLREHPVRAALAGCFGNRSLRRLHCDVLGEQSRRHVRAQDIADDPGLTERDVRPAVLRRWCSAVGVNTPVAARLEGISPAFGYLEGEVAVVLGPSSRRGNLG